MFPFRGFFFPSRLDAEIAYACSKQPMFYFPLFIKSNEVLCTILLLFAPAGRGGLYTIQLYNCCMNTASYLEVIMHHETVPCSLWRPFGCISRRRLSHSKLHSSLDPPEEESNPLMSYADRDFSPTPCCFSKGFLKRSVAILRPGLGSARLGSVIQKASSPQRNGAVPGSLRMAPAESSGGIWACETTGMSGRSPAWSWQWPKG